MRPPSDEELMLSVRDGEPDAFEQLVRRHQVEVWRVAYRFTGDAVEAEDLAQETFLRVFEASARYRPAAAFRTYLYCILNRLCLDHVRKKRPAASDELSAVADPSPSPEAAIHRKERDSLVQDAVSSLPPNQRMAVALRYSGGLGWTAIAETMGVSPKAVERLLARGRSTLEHLLAAFFKD
ncbi:MAG: sigma-70 family RNA polymerase sigma factor [Candidatus Riflebacteria bacterium]|nr:sigma-70 family RNA polymerase sigma factor [Candidatus Riflebacteria bacterium]